MSKLVNKRILLEWNGDIFKDNTIPFAIDRLVPMADADGIFVHSGDKKYRLMFPVAKHRKKNGKRASYIQEFNHQTNLNHEYKLIPLCKLYHGKKLISSGVTLIVFNRTLDDKPEYNDFVTSNWNFNPIWGYSSEVANVVYR